MALSQTLIYMLSKTQLITDYDTKQILLFTVLYCFSHNKNLSFPRWLLAEDDTYQCLLS